MTARATADICNTRGLHARASAKFVKMASTFDAEVHVTRDGVTVNALSIMGLLMLGAGNGCAIEISAEGAAAEAAVAVKDQAMRILAASLAQFDSDPMQATRAVKQQAQTLKALAMKTSDSRLAVAAAGLEGCLASGHPTKATLAGPIGALLLLADPETQLTRAG